MRKYLLFFILSPLFTLFFLQTPSLFQQKILAAKNVHCTCSGKNKYTCDDKYTNSCKYKEEKCVATNDTKPVEIKQIVQRKPGMQATNYVGVKCQNDIKCTCSGNNLICSSPEDPQPEKKDCGTNNTCRNGNFTHTAFGGQTVHGADCQPICKCNGTNGQPGTHGKTGNGNNGWTCSDTSKNGSCNNKEDYCQNDPQSQNGVKCLLSTKCTCSQDKTKLNCISVGSGPKDSKGQPTDENQTFDCQAADRICVERGDLSHDTFNQQVPGADCLPANAVLRKSPDISPPPSPPCAPGGWHSYRCTNFETGIGGMSTAPSGFIVRIFAILLSMAGSIALLLIIRAGYQMMTSQGKPEALQQAREQLTAAVIGLLFLIFAFVLLEVIGVGILHIPGFTG